MKLKGREGMDFIRANIVDVVAQTIRYGEVCVSHGQIKTIHQMGEERADQPYLMPGFVDAHVHIESSMLMPDEFAIAALEKGTLASVSDPHEITNVLGLEGIRFMQRRAALTPFNIMFGAPSCVPATPFETAGAELTAGDIQGLLASGDCGYLSEVMNFPGVLNKAPDVMTKLKVAQGLGVRIDGHAPGLKGDLAKQYAASGITTDHECTTLEEAEAKLAGGMSILIREGSAATDFETLHSLLSSDPDRVMLCSDDKHPDDILVGHIREHVIRGINLGHPLFNVLRAATFNPVKHYQLSLGLLQVGDNFDALLVNNLNDFYIKNAWLKGEKIVENQSCLLEHHDAEYLNKFVAESISAEQLMVAHPGCACRIIIAQEGQLFTRKSVASVPMHNGKIVADVDNDILFLAVINRYENNAPAVALIKGFGLKEGAIASSVAHDSHNIVVVGTSAEWLARAINEVIAHKGGLAAVNPTATQVLPLPVAGLMSDKPAKIVGPLYHELNDSAKEMGCTLRAPFMTLSFMSLLVIPELKLSDKGLFDGRKFEFCSLAASDEEIEQLDVGGAKNRAAVSVIAE